MATMMLLVTNTAAMGRFRAHPWLAGIGWSATLLMTSAVTAMLVSIAM
jgi:hypothetical protein